MEEVYYNEEVFYSIEEAKRSRIYTAHSGDEIYCNTVFMKELGYYYKLKLGQTIYIYPKNNNIRENGTAAKVIKVIKNKKYPNKKWWQFWIKQEEYVTGYNLMII